MLFIKGNKEVSELKDYFLCKERTQFEGAGSQF